MAGMSPGSIVLFGSGEISASAQAAYEYLVRGLRPPIRLCVLETPAGFELNSPRVAGKVADYLREHLRHVSPEVRVIPARKRGTPFTPDDPAIAAPLLTANMIFAGPGSPTYAVRQLKDSLTWQIVLARHRMGAGLVLASAAVIAASALTLPVYEIYKVGEDLHWVPGLDLLGAYGLHLALVSHWNNREGGAELDTSRCYMGRERFAQLIEMLPPGLTLVGIDEYTALAMDLVAGTCHTIGPGGVTVLREGQEYRMARKRTWPLAELGAIRLPDPGEGLPSTVWQQVLAARDTLEAPPQPPAEVLAMTEERKAARAARDWATADQLRERVSALGWQINDTPEGPKLIPSAYAAERTVAAPISR